MNTVTAWAEIWVNLKIKDSTALVPIVMALHNKTNSLLVGFLKIYSQGLVAESPALLFGLALCDIHSQNQRTDEDYFIKPLPVSSCHKLPWSNVACHKKERRCALQNTKSSAVMPRCQRYCQPFVGGHHFHLRFIDKAYQYFIAVAVMLGWYNVNWDLFQSRMPQCSIRRLRFK